MDPITLAIILGLIGSAAGVVGGVMNSVDQAEANTANKEIQESINAANLEEAERNRQFQLMMSNTAHQREVADLKAAGLNPYSSVEGPGAAVTAGAVGQSSASRMQSTDSGAALANLASTAQSMAFMMALSGNAKMNAQSRVMSSMIRALR